MKHMKRRLSTLEESLISQDPPAGLVVMPDGTSYFRGVKYETEAEGRAEQAKSPGEKITLKIQVEDCRVRSETGDETNVED